MRLLLTGAGGIPSINFAWCVGDSDLAEEVGMVGAEYDRYNIERSVIAPTFAVPRADDPDYVKRVNQILEQEDLEYLHSQPDVEVQRISRDRNSISARMFLPSRETIEICSDKFRTADFLEIEGFRVPRTEMLLTAESLSDQVSRIEGDIVWIRASRGAGGLHSLPCKKGELKLMESWIDHWQGWGNFTASEYLPGRNLAWQSIWSEGELVASVCWERIRYIISRCSPSGITGTPDVSTIVTRPDVNEICESVVTKIEGDANGIFSIDLREDSGGVPCITEINAGRFFTPTYFFARAGVNFPEIYLRLMAGREPRVEAARDGAREGAVWIRGIDVAPRCV